MEWEIEHTDEWGDWFDGLTDEQQMAVAQVLELLHRRGPSLRRPYAGEIKGSAFDPQMKELRIDFSRAALRILFMFDPRRTAILLLGGDKSGLWNRWYATAIPAADDLYRTYLDELRQEGLI